MAGTRCEASLDEYTMLLLSTQRWRALFGSVFPSAPEADPSKGVIRDLEDPDLAIVAMRVAARHSGILGAVPEADLQETCHLSKVTAEVRKLKNPSCALQDVQNMFRLRI